MQMEEITNKNAQLVAEAEKSSSTAHMLTQQLAESLESFTINKISE